MSPITSYETFEIRCDRCGIDFRDRRTTRNSPRPKEELEVIATRNGWFITMDDPPCAICDKCSKEIQRAIKAQKQKQKEIPRVDCRKEANDAP